MNKEERLIEIIRQIPKLDLSLKEITPKNEKERKLLEAIDKAAKDDE